MEMQTRKRITLLEATRWLREARDAYNAARRAAHADISNWEIQNELGDTYRMLQRARRAYKHAGGF